jgi:hypothetical protein
MYLNIYHPRHISGASQQNHRAAMLARDRVLLHCVRQFSIQQLPDAIANHRRRRANCYLAQAIASRRPDSA